MGSLASSEGELGLTGGVGMSRADAPRRGSAFTCVEDTRLDVVFGGSFADCLGSDRLSPQESAIEGAQTRGARREVRHLGLHRTGHVIF